MSERTALSLWRRWWAWLHRSMFGQMTILACILMAAGLYVLAIRPIQQVLTAPAAYDALDITAQKVRETINAFLLTHETVPDAPESAQFRKFMAQVQRANPDFRYSMRIDDRTYGNTGTPRYFAANGLDRLLALRRDLKVPGMCSQLYRNLSTAQEKAGLEFIDCGTARYYEFYGLTHAVKTDINRTDQAFSKMFWSYSSAFVYTVLAAFFLVALVVLGNMLLIRRVARVAYSFDPGKLDHQLPEEGLPHEILPLVRATNHLIVSLAGMQQRQKFFLSAAAHELRTPLTVLRTRIELIEESPMKDKLVGDVRRMVGLVNQLLTLMKIGGLQEVSDPVDLVAAARKAVADLTGLAGGRGITLYFEPQIARFEMRGEAELLEIAIANLVDNAISFTPDGGQVFIALNVDGVVAVRDVGPGIDEANATNLFEPFVRYRSKRKGYGLGLAIVKAIVQLHAGTVVARNAEDGPGAVFQLQFPSLDGEIVPQDNG